ncbi:MAG: benzoate-CoA ligase family protein [Acidobacteria bacterium]|nr:benzoate-CoA ligase family protein [Acidobacteriota bacterium]
MTASALTAASLGIPERFNAAVHFVDRNVAEGRGDRVAIECGDLRLTYADVLRDVNRVGHALRRLDVRPEERVLLLLLDGPAFASCFFGAIKIGAVPVPLNTLWKPADYAHVLHDSRAAVLIISAELLPQIEGLPADDRRSLRHIIVVGQAGSGPSHRSFDPLDKLIGDESPELEAESTSRDAPAFWLYSSGSTGAPKGCVHLQHDMVMCAELFGKGILGIGPDDRCFSVAKLFFAYGLGNALYFPFSVGATAIHWPGPPTPQHVYAVIERHRPTLFSSVPTGYGMMLAHTRPGAPPRVGAELAPPEPWPTKVGPRDDFDLSSVRLAVSAGEALPPALYERFKQRFGVDIIDGIGSTEALHMFISNRPGAIRPGSSGQIVRGYEARLLDDDGQRVPPMEIGNLWVKGDSVCASYWNQHEKTKDTIEGRWIRTGDKYTRDDDGYFWYAGRSDDMLKVGGQWVSPVEVENVLAAHVAVLESGVVGHEDRDGLVKPMAFVVLRAGLAGTPELAKELQQFVRERVADYKRPRRVEFLPELPKTATGKIQRFRLRALAERQT